MNKQNLFLDKKVFFVTVIAMLVLTLTLTGCQSGQQSSISGQVVQQQVLKIGVFTPLTGDAAIYGEAMKQGLDLAAKDINAQGGILGHNVELVYEDTHLDAKLAVSAANKFIDVDGMDIVIAAEGSGATLAALPLADQTQTIMMVGIASTPSIKDAGDYVFRVMPSDTYQGKEIAKLAKELDYKKVAILYVNDAYGIGVKDFFTSEFTLGGRKIVTTESFDNSATDFKAQLTKIKSANPEAVLIIARQSYPLVLKQAKELGLNTQFITSAEFKDDAMLNASGKLAEGLYTPFFAEPTDYVNYKAKFMAEYGKEPSTYSDYGYDALRVIAEAANNAGSIDSTTLKNALYNVDYKGATGEVTFDHNGEVDGKPFVFYHVQNGKFVEVTE